MATSTSRPTARVARLGRRTLKMLAYAFAFVLPPLLVMAGTLGGVTMQNFLKPAPALAQQLPEPPAHDPAKPTAVVMAGNVATEVSDLLGPYEVLAASGAFNVYVIAPERKLTPLVPVPLQQCCADMDIVPHYSFAEYDQVIGTTPDLVVVPYIPRADVEDAAVLSWLRDHPGEQTVILSICGGAQMVADSGILAGHTATSHHMTLPVVLKSHPEVNWVRGLRYVDDGRFISTAGVTSGIDGTLYVLQRFFGRDVAEETAQRIGYPYLRFLDDPTWVLPEDKDLVALPNLFRFGHTQIGMLMYPGVDELALSSVTDTYPRSFAADVLTISLERQVIRTRHGLDLVPRYDLAAVGKLDRMFIPGRADAMTTATVEQWAASRPGLAVEQIHPAGVFPYDATFMDLARHETQPIAANAARWIEYPIADLQLAGPAWQPMLMLRALVFGMLGVMIARGIGPAWRLLKRPRRARTASRPTVTSSGTP